MGADIARFVEELYALPPQEFTRARDTRAAALKAAGRAGEAQAVRRLRRPSAVLWATNQLAHAEPEQLETFVHTVGELRRRQLQDPRAAGEALRRQRSELEALVRRAGQLLAQHGQRATPAIERRVSDTLLGAAVDAQLAEDLRHGRLLAEQRAPGFEVLGGARPASPLRLVHSGDGGGRHGDDRQAARRTERELRLKDVETRRRAAEAARHAEHERRAQEAQAHRRQAADLVEAAERAERELRDLQARVAESRQRLRQAQQAARKATTAARLAERRIHR
jgi:hypothetical protein